ncbi:MAG: aminotransferase [Bacteroidetes bacterium GWF2_33_16]|nr:MAG: aminotransferase [Bacteroidetes bacterium GWE2_32_14]OFY06509.1 MAG: aminotransferase [Bacteroidetes bacterium GWF2_33_16]
MTNSAINKTPIDAGVVKKKIEASGLEKVGLGAIRELVRLVNEIEKETGEKYIRMEMGVPGLPPAQIGIDGEIEALRKGVASKYPMIEGVDILKTEISRFVKNFMNIDVDSKNCIPTVGSMQGGMASFMVSCRRDANKDTTLFIDPGFPVQKQQHRVLGLKFESFDVYNYRGEKLRSKLESYLSKGNISTILYSNPNNPSWICFTEQELQIIGELANKYDVVVMEDLAYFAMDFRKDMSKPGIPPYQSSVANYTKNYILLISSSKSFSYAGQRVGMLVISNELFDRKFPDLKRFFKTDGFGYSMIYGAVYSLSSGTSHSAQYGLAAMLKAANDGDFNFVEGVREYGERAKIMKKLFADNGFKIVYDMDEDQPLADGFYFTFSYPGFDGVDLLEKLLYYGISAISLITTGSERIEGLRACVSQIQRAQLPILEERLRIFNQHHKQS